MGARREKDIFGRISDLIDGYAESEAERYRLEAAAAPVQDAIGPLSSAFTLEELAALGRRFDPATLAWDWSTYIKESPDWIFDLFEGPGGRYRRVIKPEDCEHIEKRRLGHMAECRVCRAKFIVHYTYTTAPKESA